MWELACSDGLGGLQRSKATDMVGGGRGLPQRRFFRTGGRESRPMRRQDKERRHGGGRGGGVLHAVIGWSAILAPWGTRQGGEELSGCVTIPPRDHRPGCGCARCQRSTMGWRGSGSAGAGWRP